MNMSLLNQQKVPLPWHGNAATQTTVLRHTMIFTRELHRESFQVFRVPFSKEPLVLSGQFGLSYTNHQGASLHLESH